MNPGDVGPNRGLKLAVQQGLAALFATMAERKTQVTVRMWKAMLMATLHSWRDTVVASTFQHAFRTALGAAPHEKAGELWAGETPATRIPRSEHVVRIIIAKGALEAERRRKAADKAAEAAAAVALEQAEAEQKAAMEAEARKQVIAELMGSARAMGWEPGQTQQLELLFAQHRAAEPPPVAAPIPALPPIPLARPEIPDFPLGPGPPVPYTVHVPADRETLPVYRLLAARPAIAVSVTPGAPRCQARGEERREEARRAEARCEAPHGEERQAPHRRGADSGASSVRGRQREGPRWRRRGGHGGGEGGAEARRGAEDGGGRGA